MKFWYQNKKIALLLYPLAALFGSISALRRSIYRFGLKKVHHLPVPVIVVGNINVGGSGKTPLVIWLADYLKKSGLCIGVISRGYRGQYRHLLSVQPDTDPRLAGDEAVLIAQKCACPVYVSRQRVKAAQALLNDHDCDCIISDDGLQHYALYRDIEIAVIDGQRGLGNGFLIPAGPLREGPDRLKQVDLIISKGFWRSDVPAMQWHIELIHPQQGPINWSVLKGRRVHAVSGIANPNAFFASLRAQGLDLVEHVFADHHDFQASDLQFDDTDPIVMTEKDAVKCYRFNDNIYIARLHIEPPQSFIQSLECLIHEKKIIGHSGLSTVQRRIDL